VDVKWVKIRSWHAVKEQGEPNAKSWARTYCGRESSMDWSEEITKGHIFDDLPAERSCESCLRIIARKGDQA
jgi:hypothetical protein